MHFASDGAQNSAWVGAGGQRGAKRSGSVDGGHHRDLGSSTTLSGNKRIKKSRICVQAMALAALDIPRDEMKYVGSVASMATAACGSPDSCFKGMGLGGREYPSRIPSDQGLVCLRTRGFCFRSPRVSSPTLTRRPYSHLATCCGGEPSRCRQALHCYARDGMVQGARLCSSDLGVQDSDSIAYLTQALVARVQTLKQEAKRPWGEVA